MPSPTRSPRLYVRVHHFSDLDSHYYWSTGQFAWASLTSAAVFTENEIQRFAERQGDYHIVLDNGQPCYIPPEGGWLELPCVLRLKTTQEYLADLRTVRLENTK